MFAREGFAYRGGKIALHRGFQSGSGWEMAGALDFLGQ